MNKFSAIAILFLGAYLSNSASASTSSCYEYYVGDAPYLAHKSTYSASEAALDVTFGMTTTQSSPFSNTIYSYFGANSSGGTETVAGVVPYAATWRWGGVSAIGHQTGAIFYYIESTYSNVCNGSETYSTPSRPYVDINPSTVYEGQTAYFSWGALGATQCYLDRTTPIGAIGNNVSVVATLSDSKTYYVHCTNYFGASQTVNDSLTVNPVVPCSIDFSLTSNYQISPIPTMPSISASITSLTPSNASVSWSAQITHNSPSGCGTTAFNSNTVTGSGNSFSPTFSQIYGGDLSITAACSAQNFDSNSKTDNTHDIVGIEPSKASIVSEIGTMGSPFESEDLRKISCHESSMKQFSISGIPTYGPGGDAGLMQICFNRQPNDLWNWKSNISSGRSILEFAKNPSEDWLDLEVLRGATAYTTAMWRDESVHRYNAGTGLSIDAYREWNSVLRDWVIVDRGGVGGYVPAVNAKSASCTS